MTGVWVSLWACTGTKSPEDLSPSSPTGTTQTTSDPKNDKRWADLSEQVEAALSAQGVPGMQVAVVLDGELRYAGGFGVRTWETDRPVTDQSLFRWASVSKMHTATAALQLVEDGLVDLDAPITDTVPYFHLTSGFDASSITLRHLLTHTSGLPDILDWNCDIGETGLVDAVAGWDLPLHAPAGSFYNYSNTGYSLAGAMIEELTGESFQDVLRQRVLDPSGMNNATFDVGEAIDQGHADGTTLVGGEPFVYTIEDWDCAVSRPAAWLHATASDLAQTAVWQMSADGAGLLSPETISAMHDQLDTGYWSDQSYRVGMGQFTDTTYNGERIVLHDGWVTGFTSMWIVAPERGFGVAIVANADWADPYSLAYAATDLFLDLDYVAPPDDRTDPSTWSRFTGVYADPYAYGTIDVALRGTELWAVLPELNTEAQLVQYGASYFYTTILDQPIDVRFVEDDTGVVRWFVSRYAVGTREDGGPVARSARTWTSPPRAPGPREPGEPRPRRPGSAR